MTHMSVGIGFDEILEQVQIPLNSIGVSLGGDYIISSSHRATYLERMSQEIKSPPIKLFDVPSETSGFFGHDLDLFASASGSDLRIVRLNQLEMLATIAIKPGSLHVPATANSRKIGAVSPNGHAFTVDDKHVIKDTGIIIPKGKEVIWSSTAYPVGYAWSDKDFAYIFLRSRSQDRGAIIKSNRGMTVYGVWANFKTKRHELYLTTKDEPNILYRVYSHGDKAQFDPVHTFRSDVTINNLTSFSDGRPAVVSGHRLSEPVADVVPEPKKLSELIANSLRSSYRSSVIKCIGSSYYVSWTQTPVTPPVPAVTDYGSTGRPVHEVMGAKTDLKIEAPMVNRIRSIQAPNSQKINYRLISKLPIETHMASECVVIADYLGDVASGMYSPTVRMLYDMGLAVAIVPVNKLKKTMKTAIHDLGYDLIDVAKDLERIHAGKDLILMLDGSTSPVIKNRKLVGGQYYRDFIVIDGKTEDFDLVKRKKKMRGKITSIVIEPTENYPSVPEGVNTRIINFENKNPHEVVKREIISLLPSVRI